MSFLVFNSFKVFFLILIFFSKPLHANNNKNTCEVLLDVLSINTTAYKNCLMKKPNNEFSREDLDKCKKYYLSEIERLSYVFKNVCK